eukprot:1147913-Pelagomonas_calceolata.AAC.1
MELSDLKNSPALRERSRGYEDGCMGLPLGVRQSRGLERVVKEERRHLASYTRQGCSCKAGLSVQKCSGCGQEDSPHRSCSLNGGQELCDEFAAPSAKAALLRLDLRCKRAARPGLG